MKQRKRLVLGGNAYANYIASLVPTLWLRLRETTGTIAANSGSGGSALNGTIAGTTTLAQPGKLGANEAVDFDGATSIITIANHASLANMTTQRWLCLVSPDTLGEANGGKLWAWGDAGSQRHFLSLLPSNNIGAFIRGDGGSDAVAQTVAGPIAPSIGAWTGFFMDYDDANVLGLGRKVRLWMVTGGTVTLLTLAANTALTGTVRPMPDNLHIGNRQDAGHTFDGHYDELACWSGRLWTTQEITTISRLAGIIT